MNQQRQLGFAKGLFFLMNLASLLYSTGCQQSEWVDGESYLSASTATLSPANLRDRAARRAFDGAPPVVPHKAFGPACVTCHAMEAKSIPTVGIAPANPHFGDVREGSLVNCQQCHLFASTEKAFVESSFIGMPQVYHMAERAHPLAPPVIPHALNMRANCSACHAGSAARPEIVCSHPERANCVQCHLVQKEREEESPGALATTHLEDL